jgi:hypothetical protein
VNKYDTHYRPNRDYDHKPVAPWTRELTRHLLKRQHAKEWFIGAGTLLLIGVAIWAGLKAGEIGLL